MSAAAIPRQPVPLGDLPAGAFRFTQAIRFPHCDAAGIVYTGRHIDLLNIAIEAFYEAQGLDYYALLQQRRIGLGYASVGMDFHTPAFMGDELTFSVLVTRVGRSSLGLHVPAHRGDTPILQARMVSVTTDLNRHVSIPLPSDIRAAMSAYQERCR